MVSSSSLNKLLKSTNFREQVRSGTFGRSCRTGQYFAKNHPSDKNLKMYFVFKLIYFR